jgi:hypothetical protein
VLEAKMKGRRCKIVTCGYEMPGWEAAAYEVVMGTQLHLYDWGGAVSWAAEAGGEGGDGSDDDSWSFPHAASEDLLQHRPQHLSDRPLDSERFRGATIIDKTRRHFIRGFNPDAKDEVILDIFEEWELEKAEKEKKRKEKEEAEALRSDASEGSIESEADDKPPSG